MSRPKNHHYVPRHFLRAWDLEDKLNVLHLESEGVFQEDISKVCSRNYFYGNPPTVETEISNLEGYQARPLNTLRDGSNLTDLSDEEIRLLLSFVTTQRSRTKAMKEDINTGEEFLRDAVRDDMEADRYEEFIEWTSDLSEEEKEDTIVEASLLGTHYYIISLGIFAYIGIQDLDAVMIRNVTDRDFIVCDAPVVHDNPRYKAFRGLVLAALGNRGLQLFCPVDRNRMLLLYDPEVYQLESNSRRQVLIKSPEVVDQLNLLQLHNAEEIVMSRPGSEQYVLELYDRIEEVRRRKEITETIETELGDNVEVDKVPPYQVPKLSPELPGYSLRDRLSYKKKRPRSQAPKSQRVVHRIFNEAGAPDLALICAIRFFEELLEQ